MKHLLVIAMSLVAFFVPNLVGFGLWVLAGGFPTVLRSFTAILGWVLSFGISSLLFWRLVQVAFGEGVPR